MPFVPKKEVVEAFARYLLSQDYPKVPDWEADEKYGSREHRFYPSEAVKSDYEERARQMLISARSNSGSGG